MPPERDEPRAAADKFDDDHYPAYTMGRAAEMLGTTPGFLRSLDEAKLIEPQRSRGGHRRYSRHQLRIAARVRELVDQGTGLDAACRIVTLEDQLREARDLNKKLSPPPEQEYPPLRGV
ncbi:MerR family transcriptional regulator [Actinosynnema sp. NPDC059797]